MRYFSQVTFSPLFNTGSLDDNERTKLMQAIDVHGYRGPSKKRHNGVVPIRPVDKKLLKDLQLFFDNEDSDVKKKYESCCPVKVVAHVPSGKRLVGFILSQQDSFELYIVGTSQYN